MEEDGTELEPFDVYECVTIGEYDVRCNLIDIRGRVCNWVGHVGPRLGNVQLLIDKHYVTWVHKG